MKTVAVRATDTTNATPPILTSKIWCSFTNTSTARTEAVSVLATKPAGPHWLRAASNRSPRRARPKRRQHEHAGTPGRQRHGMDRDRRARGLCERHELRASDAAVPRAV